MKRYVSLLRFTEQGARNIKASAARAQQFAKAAAKAGVTVEAQYWTTGSLDGILILAAESEKKILQLLTELTALGNVRTETIQAFTAKELKGLAD